MEDIKEQSEERTPVFLKIMIIALVITFAFLIFTIIDRECNGGRIQYSFRFSKQCNYTVPDGYKLVFSKKENAYLIKINEYNDYYLYEGVNHFKGMFSTIALPALFNDSCTAKAALKQYIEDKQPKIMDAK